MGRPIVQILIVATVALATGGSVADTSADAFAAMGIKPADVLSGTVLNARVIAGPDKQVVAMTTYFTGSRDKNDAVNVRLDVFLRRGTRLHSIYSRDYGAENGGSVAGGELQLVDIDADGINDIILSFDWFADPLIEQRLGEVILYGGNGFRSAWSGPVKYDATRAARKVPVERRDRYSRELDIRRTLGTRGTTLFFNKRVVAVAGERLAEPKVVVESFPPDGGPAAESGGG